MTRPEQRRSPPRPAVYPPRASPENGDRAAESGPRERRAVFAWFFGAVQVLFLILVIAAALAADHGTAEAVSHQVARTCLNGAWRGQFASQRACLEHFHVALPAGQEVDPGLGPGLVAIAWAVADACLGLGYGLDRLARRRR